MLTVGMKTRTYYSIDRHDHPDWKMIGTESGSNSGVIRGEYSLGDETSSVHPNYNSSMIDAEQLWKFIGVRDYVIGDFMWTGIDYFRRNILAGRGAFQISEFSIFADSQKTDIIFIKVSGRKNQ